MGGYAIIAHNEHGESGKILKNRYMKKVTEYRKLLIKQKITFSERESTLEELPCPEYNKTDICRDKKGMPTVKAHDYQYRTTQPGDLFSIFEF